MKSTMSNLWRYYSLHNDWFPIRRAIPGWTTRRVDVDHKQSPAKTRVSQFSTESIRAQQVGQNNEGGKERKGKDIDSVRRETKERAK